MNVEELVLFNLIIRVDVDRIGDVNLKVKMRRVRTVRMRRRAFGPP